MLLRFVLVLNCNTKISEKSDMTKSWTLGFAACHKQELFVAQELLTKLNQSVAELRVYINYASMLPLLSTLIKTISISQKTKESLLTLAWREMHF